MTTPRHHRVRVDKTIPGCETRALGSIQLISGRVFHEREKAAREGNGYKEHTRKHSHGPVDLKQAEAEAKHRCRKSEAEI